jgi:hypothetical protein
VIYPEPFGKITAGCDKEYPIDYSHLNIMGYALGAVRRATVACMRVWRTSPAEVDKPLALTML